MCTDCGFGTCLSNVSNVCVCDPGYSHSRELFRIPDNYTCNFPNENSCLPCYTSDDTLLALYLSAACLDVVLVALVLWGKTLKQIKRYVIFIVSFVLSFIACILKVAEPWRLFGEDVTFTFLLMYSLTLGAISMLLITERLLRYVVKVMVMYPRRAVTRKIIYGVIYSHWFVAVFYLGLSSMPVVAAAMPELINKAELISPYLLVASLCLFYVQLLHNILYLRVARDLTRIANGSSPSKSSRESGRKYLTAKAKLKLQRNAVNMLFTPIVLVFPIGALNGQVYDQVFRYMLPVNSILAASCSLIFVVCYGPCRRLTVEAQRHAYKKRNILELSTRTTATLPTGTEAKSGDQLTNSM